MANDEYNALLRTGWLPWNVWRQANPNQPGLTAADLSAANLFRADLSAAFLSGADLSGRISLLRTSLRSRQITDDVSDARVYGGIHFRADQDAGALRPGGLHHSLQEQLAAHTR